jgi:D-alanyl-D-alanine carboxypeptidase
MAGSRHAMMGRMEPHEDSVEATLAELGVSPEMLAARSLVVCPEAQELVVVAIGNDGREHLLAPEAAAAWQAMSAAALSGGAILSIVSAFRSVDRQAEIFRAKLARGMSLDAILCLSAPPGYSEHHSGCAIDLATEGVAPLEPEFENTAAFRWLSRNAGRFGFVLSYPAQNPHGYTYEPWHWCFKPGALRHPGNMRE